MGKRLFSDPLCADIQKFFAAPEQQRIQMKIAAAKLPRELDALLITVDSDMKKFLADVVANFGQDALNSIALFPTKVRLATAKLENDELRAAKEATLREAERATAKLQKVAVSLQKMQAEDAAKAQWSAQQAATSKAQSAIEAKNGQRIGQSQSSP